MLRFFQRLLGALRHGHRVVAMLVWAGFTSAALAGSIDTERAELVASEDGYALAAEFRIDLGNRIEEALTHGVALHFNLECQLSHSRWYWTDEKIASRTVNYRLTYIPLTRQYRLTTGALYRNFETLDEALRALSRVGSLTVAERGQLRPGESYQAAVRLQFDRSQLPKPFQLDAFGNRDWDVTSKVYRWNYVATEARGDGR